MSKSITFVVVMVILAAIASQVSKISAQNLQQNAFCAKAAALGIPGDGCE